MNSTVIKLSDERQKLDDTVVSEQKITNELESLFSKYESSRHALLRLFANNENICDSFHNKYGHNSREAQVLGVHFDSSSKLLDVFDEYFKTEKARIKWNRDVHSNTKACERAEKHKDHIQQEKHKWISLIHKCGRILTYVSLVVVMYSAFSWLGECTDSSVGWGQCDFQIRIPIQDNLPKFDSTL